MKETGTKKKTGGFSLAPKDQVASSTIGLSSGRAVAIKHKWGVVKYTGKSEGKRATALLVTFKRDSEKTVENYTCGKGFKPNEDGSALVPQEGQTGLNPTSKAGLYFTSLQKNGQMPADFLVGEEVSALDGIDVELVRKPMEKGDGMTGDPTVLVVDDIYKAPWKLSGKKKEDDDEDDDAPKKKGKASDRDDTDEDDDEEAEDDDAPKSKKKKKAADDDDEEAEDDDASGDDDDEELDELAGEALISALDDGALKASKIEAAVRDVVKKHKRAKAIAARAAEPKFLKTEKGWSWDGKTAEKD